MNMRIKPPSTFIKLPDNEIKQLINKRMTLTDNATVRREIAQNTTPASAESFNTRQALKNIDNQLISQFDRLVNHVVNPIAPISSQNGQVLKQSLVGYVYAHLPNYNPAVSHFSTWIIDALRIKQKAIEWDKKNKTSLTIGKNDFYKPEHKYSANLALKPLSLDMPRSKEKNAESWIDYIPAKNTPSLLKNTRSVSEIIDYIEQLKILKPKPLLYYRYFLDNPSLEYNDIIKKYNLSVQREGFGISIRRSREKLNHPETKQRLKDFMGI